MYALDAYTFDLPQELIAQQPESPRERAKLMVVDRKKQTIQEATIGQLPDFLEPHDRLIFNDTKVLPARLLGNKESGGHVEFLLLEQKEPSLWVCLARPGRRLGVGAVSHFGEGLSARVLQVLPEGQRLVRFFSERPFLEVLVEKGYMPLPPYIQRAAGVEDKENYQTIFAKNWGAVAAPTAGLHFTSSLMAKLEEKGAKSFFVTLHVGLGTFSPVKVEDIRDHKIHTELGEISSETAERLNADREQHRRVCIGTTTCRVLEAFANEQGLIHAGKRPISLFIYPGYTFRSTEALLTNFHLPRSSLLMLVSAFAGYDLLRRAYQEAIAKRYRFFSYGDAMLII